MSSTLNEESTFRAVLVVGFLTIFMITIYHRLRSWESKEPLDRRQEGVFILATLRPLALAMWLGVFVYMINPGWMTWFCGFSAAVAALVWRERPGHRGCTLA